MNTALKVVLIGFGVLAGLGMIAVVLLVAIVALQNRAPTVPADFRAPTQLASPTSTAAEGMLFYDSDRTGNFEIYAADAPGDAPRRLTTDGAWDSWWPRLSPDRQHIAFYRTPKGVHDRDFNETHLWMMNADGTKAIELRPPGLDGWVQQGHADWSPDSSRLVMFGGNKTNPQIYVTNATGQQPRQVTERGGINLDPSFSPDGHTIAFIGCPQSICTLDDYEVYLTDAQDVFAGGAMAEARRLTDDHLRDHDPYFAPDGTQLAWLTQTSATGRHPGGSWNIRAAAPDGAGLRRVTDDDQINSKPEWSRDSRTIYFHRLEVPRLSGFSIFAVNADGSGLREVTAGQPGVNEFPST